MPSYSHRTVQLVNVVLDQYALRFLLVLLRLNDLQDDQRMVMDRRLAAGFPGEQKFVVIETYY